MVQLKITEAVSTAIKTYLDINPPNNDKLLDRLATTETGGQIDHQDLVALSKLLVHHYQSTGNAADVHRWRLDTLLKGSCVYVPPPPPKPEPVSMRSLPWVDADLSTERRI